MDWRHMVTKRIQTVAQHQRLLARVIFTKCMMVQFLAKVKCMTMNGKKHLKMLVDNISESDSYKVEMLQLLVWGLYNYG